MAHYAFIDENNVVTEVIVGRDENDLIDGVTSWEDYYGEFRGQRCLQTSYNTQAGQHLKGGTPFRGNYAGIGYTYDETLDAFLPPQPYASWLVDAETFSWVAPVDMPAEGQWLWNESAGVWVEVEDEVV
jgi:hypothetical protein